MTKICIEPTPDGGFSVYEDMPMEAGMEQQAAPDMEGGGEMAPQGQMAATVDEALQLARGMLEAMTADSMAGQETAESKELFKGFTKARGMPIGGV